MKKYFITGLAILLPLVITVVVAVFLVNLLTDPFIGAVSSLLTKLNIINKGFLFLSPDQLLSYGSKLLILVLLFLFTVILGVIARWFLINSLFKLGDKILHRIPLVNTVYKTTQEIINTLFVSDKNTFKQVVITPFPCEGSYVIGLVARASPAECSQAIGDELVSVFVPTTPNPTTGFLLMVKSSEMIILDMKPEEAIKYIVSCGVIVPEPKNATMTTKFS